MPTNAKKGTYLVKKLQKYANVIYERSHIGLKSEIPLDIKGRKLKQIIVIHRQFSKR